MKGLLFILLLSAATVQAQLPDTLLNNVVKDTIIAKFNRHDFAGIYTMADSGFKNSVTEQQLEGLLNSAARLGKIMGSELTGTDSSNSEYRLIFAKKSLQLNLNAVTAASYNIFGLSFYKLPVVRTRTNFLFDNPLKTGLDSVVQKAAAGYMVNKNVAGFSIGVLYKGKFFTYNFGETKKGTEQLPTKNTVYEIGSVTKTFTGILLAHAVLEGKVKLDDDIRKYIDGNYPNLQFNGEPIRLVHLSNHTSALPSQPRLPGTDEDPFAPSVNFTNDMLHSILHTITLDTLPGTRRQYSNFAVGLLGIILEKVYGMTYEQLLQHYIFKPYKMSETTITLPPGTKKMAQGYDVEGREAPYWRNRLAEPAGGIRSTAHDMLLYMKEQMNSKDSAAWLAHQLTFGTVKEGTGLNWGIYTTKKGYLRWSHDGGTDGFTSLCLIYPGMQAGIVLLTNNGDHDDNAFFTVGTAIYSYLTSLPPPPSGAGERAAKK